MLHGWTVFLELMMKQRQKKHGAGKQKWLTAIWIAACGQYIADHQHRCPGRFPWHGRLAQWLAHGKVWP